MSGTPTAGNGIELQVLAAAVIGGASLQGGEGTGSRGISWRCFCSSNQQLHDDAQGLNLLANDCHRYGFSSRRSTRYVDPSPGKHNHHLPNVYRKGGKDDKTNRRNLVQQELG